MSNVRRLCARFISTFKNTALDQEFDEEAQSHLDLAEEYVQRGMLLPEAQRLARVKFGSRTFSKDVHRDSRGLPWLEGVVYDARFALRGLLRDRSFALTAIALLTLAIALNVVTFTIMDAMIFRGLPLATRSNRLVYLHMRRPTDMPCCPGPVSYPDLEVWRSQASAFTGLALSSEFVRAPLRDEAGRSIDVEANRVSANLFGLLGVRPTIGRDFASADEAPAAAPVAVISHRLWERRFDMRADAIGATVYLNNIATTIVGVMPKGFALWYDYDLWLPISPTPAAAGRVIGRLRDSATLEEARAQIDTLTRRLHSTDPARQHDVAGTVTYSQAFLAADGPMIYGSLWAGAWIVLLIACANLANLTMVRTLGRWRELSTRIALGAGVWRMARQIVIEHFTLAAIAGTLAWWIAGWSMREWAARTATRYLAIDYTVNSSTMNYLIAITAASAVLVTLVPVIKLVQHGVRVSVRSDTRGTTQDLRGKHLTAVLVTSQMALALVLLLGAGVLVRSFRNIVNADIGVQTPDRIVVGWLRLPSSTYSTADERLAFYDRLDAQVRAIPGVESVSLSSTLPGRMVNPTDFEIEGRSHTPSSEPRTQVLFAGSDYFRVMGASAITGRTFNDGDDRSRPPVAIVNQRFVDTFLPNAQPIGQRFRTIARNTPGPWRTVVGVVPNIMQGDPTRQSFKPVVYVPARQTPSGAAFFFARTSFPADEAASAIRAVTRQLDSDVIEEDFTSLTARQAFNRDFMDKEHSELGKHAAAAPVFAVIALLLSAVGLFAVIAHSVTQRTKEIGIRMAVGARAADVRRMVFREGMVPVVIGMFAGLTVSLAANRVLQSQLVGVSPYDPMTMIVAPLVLVAVALLACQLPAQRAVNVDPVIALRHD